MNNLRKFSTETDYSAATLNYPAVSWVESGDTVYYDLSASTPTVNTKVKIAFTTDSCGGSKTFDVAGDSSMINDGIVTAITVNGEALQLSGSMPALQLSANTDYLIEYSLVDNVTDVGSSFSMQPPSTCSSTQLHFDILFPAQVANVDNLWSGIDCLILESTTPPSGSLSQSSLGSVDLYVPDSAVDTYKNHSSWGTLASRTYPISQYSGNIPV